jgi:hypothetical protein
LSHYIYDQSLNPMRIHLLCCGHGKEKTMSHDVMWNTFAFIVKDVGFHVVHEQTHIFSPHTL